MNGIHQDTKQPQKVYGRRQDYKQDPVFQNFLNSIKTDATRKMYCQFLIKYYLSQPPNNSLSLQEIIAKEHKTIEQEIINIISNMRNIQGLSYPSTLMFLCAITLFFEISDVTINKKKIGKFRGDNITKFEYRPYTHEEISTLISLSDERGKAMLLLMASTGMRVGALPGLKLKHLKRWTIGPGLNQFVYQIRVYANSPKYRYTTFCTPECTAALDRYFALRKRYGENLKQNLTSSEWQPGDSYVFIKNFSKESYPIICRPLVAYTITTYIVNRLKESGLRSRKKMIANSYSRYSEAGRHKNEIHPCHSLRIFAVTNMQRARLNKTIREMLVGHSTGLDAVYFKAQDEEILEEYCKGIYKLTISNENRLEKQADYYKHKSEGLQEIRQQLNENYEQKCNCLKRKWKKISSSYFQKLIRIIYPRGNSVQSAKINLCCFYPQLKGCSPTIYSKVYIQKSIPVLRL